MYLISSFRLERIGSLSMVFDGATVTLSTGRFAHVSFATYDASCTAFAAALQAALVTAGKASATVSYSTTTHAYTLSNGGGSFAISFSVGGAGTRMARVLGFTTGATATSHVSTVRPYYVIVTALDARVSYGGLADVEMGERRQADDGRGYVLTPTTVPQEGMWEHHHEPRAAVYDYAASSSAPWTWSHFFRHCGPWQEYFTVGLEAGDPEPAGVWQLRKTRFDRSTHERQWKDADIAWRIRIDAVRLSSL